MSYQYYLEDFINHPKEVVQKYIDKLQPLNYNKFYWWRNFSPKIKPLLKTHSFKDRVINGDYELSSYYWMAQYTAHTAKKKFDPQMDNVTRQLDKLGVDISKYRRLMVDFEKEEKERIEDFLKELHKEFFITPEQLDEELFNFDGEAKDFYIYLEGRYNKRIRIKSKRGRKKRLVN
jgi:hypothetical protein